MKTRAIILTLTVLLFSSCIVKSLQPFYIKESLKFNEKLLGTWIDNKSGEWTVESVKNKFEADKKEGIELSKEDIKAFEAYKQGYYIKYIKNKKEAGFIAMPFIVNEQFFLDFIPIEIEDDEINSLAAAHLLKTHSVAKLDNNSDDNIVFSWLSEERISDLFDTHKIRLKHETVGFDDDLLLTASSQELYAFLKKYMKSGIEDKWRKEDQLELTKKDANP